MQCGTGATWQSHAGPRERLRGAEVTRGQYLYLSYIGFIKYIGVPIIGRQIINSLIRRPLYTREFPFIFTVWTNSLISSKIYRWIKARDASRADTVDARTTGSPINTRALKFT